MIKFESVEFGKQGRGNEGEKFTANQLTEDSLDAGSVETLVADCMTAVGNDLTAFREAAWLGINKYLKSLAGGSDEASKTAALIVKGGFGGGKSKAEIAALIRSGALAKLMAG